MIAPRSFVSAVLSLSAVVMSFSAFAVEMPLRKPGLWEMKMGAQGAMPGMTMQHCTDETTDRQLSAAASPLTDGMCAKNEIAKTANGYTTDAVCTIAGKTSTTHADIIGDFNSAYAMKVTSEPQGAARNEMTIEAKWLGACKPGQKPGDIIMPGGIKINVNDLNAVRGKLPK